MNRHDSEEWSFWWILPAIFLILIATALLAGI